MGIELRARRIRVAAQVAIVVCLTTAPVLAQDPLEHVRRMYDAAAFEQALAALETVSLEDGAAVSLASQYRALCLVALRRPVEAQQAIDVMIAANPMEPITVAHVPPRFRSMVLGIWRPFMRARVEQQYLAGKTAYRAAAWDEAVAAFETVVAVMRHPELQFDQDRRLAEVGELATDYLDVARSRAAASAPAAVHQDP